MPSATRPLALVTGASSGIGADLAREFARDGHDLILTARTLAPMEALAAELEAHGASSVILPADLSRPGGGGALASAIEARGLTVDVLVTNAGLGAVGRFLLEHQLARSRPFQTMIEHQISDAHVFRRHDVRAQEAREIARLQLAARGAVDQVVLHGQARQNGSGERRPRFRRNWRLFAEFFRAQFS